MIVTDPAAFLAEFACMPVRGPATARGAFLVAPASDTLAAESAQDNRYMHLRQRFEREYAALRTDAVDEPSQVTTGVGADVDHGVAVP